MLPDDWTASTYELNNTNSYDAGFATSTITAADWANVLEPNGAVFLPAAGDRTGTSVYFNRGDYWSSSYHVDSHLAYNVGFSDSNFNTFFSITRGEGYSVRLVRNVQ